jgi:hypothetical protein
MISHICRLIAQWASRSLIWLHDLALFDNYWLKGLPIIDMATFLAHITSREVHYIAEVLSEFSSRG